MKKVFAIVLVVLFVFSVVPVFAQVPEPKTNENPDLQSYGAKSLTKAANGVGNIALGWTQPFQDVRNNGELKKGPIQVWVEGIGNGIVRTGMGVVEVVTAPVPSVGFDKDAEMKV